MKHITAVVTVIVAISLGVGTAARAEIMIPSTFDFDAEGWTLNPGAGTLTWIETGGNPGGAITAQDDVTGVMLALAPPKYLGDLSAFDGGTLSVDFIQLADAEGTPLPDLGTVTLSNGSSSASLDLVAGTIPTSWTGYEATLDAATWGVTPSTWNDILNDVTEISVVVDSFNLFGDTVGMDNFTLTAVPEPAALAIWTAGVFALRRTRST